MNKPWFIRIFLTVIFMAFSTFALAGPEISNNPMTLPPSLAGLPIITAEPWVQIDPGPDVFLEGPAFDREGNLFISSIMDSRIFKITPDKKVANIFSEEGLMPDGIAIHKDGRLFLACLTGKLAVINPDGSNLTFVEPRHQGKPQCMNDLVFDSNGNCYVTDFTGNIADPTGGVYRFSADLMDVKPVIGHLAMANGVSLSPEGDVLWVSATASNCLIRLQLQKDGISLDPFEGTHIPYRFMGAPGGCDSNAMDEKGNLYQCMIFQGRVLILNKTGIPIANVLIPGRDEGKFLRSTNVAFKPGTDEVYLTVSGDGGAWIYKFRGLAKGLILFSHK